MSNATVARVATSAVVAFVLTFFVARAVARAEVDVDDAAPRPTRALAAAVAPPAAPSPRGGAWVSVGAGVTTGRGARPAAALFAALGVATDRIFFPSVGGRAPSPEVTPPAPAPPGRAIVTPALAREVVAAAWRAASLPASDARLESVVRRARWSAALPEARLRVAQSVDDRMSLGGEVGDDTPRAYSMQGTRSSYEARLTWRLDRLVFADEEPAVERMRHDQELTRLRIAGQVLEALFAWQRAVIDAREASRADPSSREALDAGVRVAEADALLDVLTGGFWGHRRP